MKTRLLLSLLVATGLLMAADVSVGIRIGPPPPPRAVAVVPASPGAGYVWVGGYWYVVGHAWRWHEGYWSRPPYPGAVWVVPRHDGERFYEGYWEGSHGHVEHQHDWDHDRDRDYHDHEHWEHDHH